MTFMNTQKKASLNPHTDEDSIRRDLKMQSKEIARAFPKDNYNPKERPVPWIAWAGYIAQNNCSTNNSLMCYMVAAVPQGFREGRWWGVWNRLKGNSNWNSFPRERILPERQSLRPQNQGWPLLHSQEVWREERNDNLKGVLGPWDTSWTRLENCSSTMEVEEASKPLLLPCWAPKLPPCGHFILHQPFDLVWASVRDTARMQS